MSAAASVMREVFRRELLPARARWWLAAAGMRDWFGYLRKRLDGRVSATVLSRLGARMFARRYEALRRDWPHLPTDAAAHLFSSLYRLELDRGGRWIMDGLGGAPSSPIDWLRAIRLLAPMSPEARWREVTVHLGELLVVLTEDLPAELEHARKILGDLCFDAGVRYARRMKRAWGIEVTADVNAPALAMEVLRTSEYLFRVNPTHWGESDAASNTGYLEGTACPWFERPGWNAAHCGIFGQFQSGVSSEFGLRYILGKTIPKHGGHTCRIDLKPLDASTLLRKARLHGAS